jgi:DNA repair protein RadC
MSEKELERPHYLGHWDRLRKRFEKSKFDGFHDYEVLELLLTYVIHGRDTKPCAKALLREFGSFKNVFDATQEALLKVEGIGPKAALFIKVLRETIAEYFKSKIKEEKVFLNLKELVDYLNAEIGGQQNEVVHVLYLNSKNEFLYGENFGGGTVSEAVAFPRRIVEEALRRNAASVILAHNHPGGLAEPSKADNSLTSAVQSALKTVDINLQEHIIISGEGYYSYRANGFFDDI